MGHPRTRRVVVVGASAGGVHALPSLVAQLPASLDAPVLIVQHLRPGFGDHLLEMMRRSCVLPVQWADHEGELVSGTVYLARPDVHLLVDDHRTLLVDGPRENHARPSINRLFRSAAAHHDSRVVGVILTGLLDDGAAGLVAVRRCGGAVLVEDPRYAAFPEMPRNAIEAVAPDAIVPLSEMGAAITYLVQSPVRRASNIPEDVLIEAELDATGRSDIGAMRALGPQMALSCAECGGPLWRVGDGRSVSYRCFMGHASSSHTLLADKANEVERALWTAVRALEERSTALSRLAQSRSSESDAARRADYEARSREAELHANRARELLLRLRRANHEPVTRPS